MIAHSNLFNVRVHVGYVTAILLINVLDGQFGDGRLIDASLSSMPMRSSCLVDICTDLHAKIMDERVIFPDSNLEYCQILLEYIGCLNDSHRSCHSMLHFHSALTAAKQQWRRFKCAQFREQFSEQHETCPFWEESTSTQQCSMFGNLHLLPFSVVNDRSDHVGGIKTCSFNGAHPLIDNRFFVIQLTSSSVAHNSSYSGNFDKRLFRPLLSKITKVTILIKTFIGCIPNQLLYETGISSGENSDKVSQNVSISTTFSDGSKNFEIEEIGRIRPNRFKTVVELANISDSHIEIRLFYLRTDYEDMPLSQLCRNSLSCTSSRRNSAIIKEASLLIQPRLFLNCLLNGQLEGIESVPALRDQAIGICIEKEFLGEFFDLCVYHVSMFHAFHTSSFNDLEQILSNLRVVQQQLNRPNVTSIASNRRQWLKPNPDSHRSCRIFPQEKATSFESNAMSHSLEWISLYLLNLSNIFVLISPYENMARRSSSLLLQRRMIPLGLEKGHFFVLLLICPPSSEVVNFGQRWSACSFSSLSLLCFPSVARKTTEVASAKRLRPLLEKREIKVEWQHVSSTAARVVVMGLCAHWAKGWRQKVKVLEKKTESRRKDLLPTGLYSCQRS
ncbi:RGM domain family member drag-1 [Ditylenchus destructor]|uniref:RGM domain family member drag-1 n=1 Tax=Ditylenchus destructor TaxID=166010 RepID=A0AAD4NL50_9BILA|nr:RGM domain family member drag-1 [Ditylenchus destructor]